jgi:hypothetical protein
MPKSSQAEELEHQLSTKTEEKASWDWATSGTFYL